MRLASCSSWPRRRRYSAEAQRYTRRHPAPDAPDRVARVEADTAEARRLWRELARFLVKQITIGSDGDGATRVRITSHFGPPAEAEADGFGMVYKTLKDSLMRASINSFLAVLRSSASSGAASLGPGI